MRRFKAKFTMLTVALFASILFGASLAWGQTTIRVPDLPSRTFNYANPDLPRYFTDNPDIVRADNEPRHNRMSNDGATLGRVLFYDVLLSGNNTISCASCHTQANAFADPQQLSIGVNGVTARNSPNLSNGRYYVPGKFFWDERANSAEDQALAPIQDHIEMGQTLDTLIVELEATDHYPALFSAAFGDDQITDERIGDALAQFVRSLISHESKFDRGLETNFSNFTNQELRGLQLFQSNRARCIGCHTTELMISETARNIGLDATTIDEGKSGITNNRSDEAAFKSPSLRNVSVTGPFMHDGRFETLNDVVNFYNSQIQNHRNLDIILRGQNGPIRMGLNQADRAALVAFLETFTDDSFLTDEKFSDPFVESVVRNTPTPAPTIVPGATPVPTATPAPPITGIIFSDDFESNQGWETDPFDADNATTGMWEVTDPQATNLNGAKQLGNAFSGSRVLVTGGRAGSGAGSFDVDNGLTTSQSPLIELPAGARYDLSFAHYFAHASNATQDDFLRVFVAGEEDVIAVLDVAGRGADVDAAWRTLTADISQFAGESIQIIVQAADAGSPSLVEAALDNIVITSDASASVSGLDLSRSVDRDVSNESGAELVVDIDVIVTAGDATADEDGLSLAEPVVPTSVGIRTMQTGSSFISLMMMLRLIVSVCLISATMRLVKKSYW